MSSPYCVEVLPTRQFRELVRIAAMLCAFVLMPARPACTRSAARAHVGNQDQPKKIPQDSNTPPAEQILSSYEGQSVTSVEIAGRPDLKTANFRPKLAQKEGQPFAQGQRQTPAAAALKATANFRMSAFR